MRLWQRARRRFSEFNRLSPSTWPLFDIVLEAKKLLQLLRDRKVGMYCHTPPKPT
jgi:hypothetical protein